MRNTILMSAAAFAILSTATMAAPAPDTDKVCPEDQGGKTMFVSGPVREVGHDGFSQYMVVVDNETSCHVVIFVDDGVAPCAYGEQASIALKVRKADGEVNYYDGGGDEPYVCGKPPGVTKPTK